jgi:hypothetical protein
LLSLGRRWPGLPDHVLHFLRTMNTDRDEDGRFLIGGDVFAGLGYGDVVVGPDAVFFVAGEAPGLAREQ